MTVSSSTDRVRYAGNGSTTAFPTTFKFANNADLKVILRNTANVETVLTETTHYTLTGAGLDAGGTVTMLTAPASGEILVILREVVKTQDTDYVANDPFPAEAHEAALDKLTYIAQEHEEELKRTIYAPATDLTPNFELPIAENRAGKVLGFDSNGDISVDVAGTVATFGGTLSQSSQIATAGQTVFTVPAYTVAANTLKVYVNGVLMERGASADYVETNATTITFNNGLTLNDKVLVEIGSIVGSVSTANAASILFTDGKSVQDLRDAASGLGASMIAVEDAGGFFAGVELETIIQAIGQHLLSNQHFIPIPLYALRETVNFDVGNAAANGGVLASDTTPVLDAINAATDGCQRLLWAASNNDQVAFQIPLPPNLDTSANVVIHMRIASGGTTDAVGFTVECFSNEGDTKVSVSSGTNMTTAYAEVEAAIAAADVPVGAQTLTVGLTPVAHTTDTLALSAVWVEYTGLLRAV